MTKLFQVLIAAIALAAPACAQSFTERGSFTETGNFLRPPTATVGPVITPQAFVMHVHNPSMTLPTISVGGLRVWGTSCEWNTVETGSLGSPVFDWSCLGDETAGTGWIGYAKKFGVNLIWTWGQVPRFGSTMSNDSPSNFPITFPVANNGIAWSGNVVTVTTLQRQNSAAGDSVTVAGATGCPFTINGTWTLTQANNPTDYPWTYVFNVSGATGSGTCGGAAVTFQNNSQLVTRCSGTGLPPNGQGGGCYSPFDVGVDGSGADAFITAAETSMIAYLVIHDPMNRMKYWEMWNEPQGPGFYNGSIASMARMQKDTFALIAASSRPDIILTTPAPSGGLTSPAAYLGLFGADPSHPFQYAKQIDFHSYNYPSGSAAPNPGDVLTTIANIKVAIASLPFSSGLPFGMSEGSWGQGAWSLSGPQGPNTGTTAILNHANWAALWDVYHTCAGLVYHGWFAWDQNNGSGLITGTTPPIGTEPSAIATQLMHDWLVGGSLTQNCRKDISNNWTVQVGRSGGYVGTIIWNVNLTNVGSYPIPAGFYTQYRDISGQVWPITPTQTSLPVQADPIIAETQPPPFNMTTPVMLPSGRVGSLYNATLNSVGGAGAVQWTELTLPSVFQSLALTLNQATGQISGTPSASGNFSTYVFGQDTNGQTYTQNMLLSIASGGGGANLDDLYCPSGDSSCNFGGTDATATLPTSGMSTDPAFTPSPGSTLTATSCADFVAKLAAAVGGETIVLPAVNTGCGPINLPVAAGASDSQWVTIKTDQTGAAGFPAYGTRATPCQIGLGSITGYPSFLCSSPLRLMPQLTCSTVNCQVITTSSGASFYRLTGIEVIGPSTTNSNNYLVGLNNSNDHIILDRMAIHGFPNPMFLTTFEDKGGVSVNGSTNIAIVDSWLWDFMCVKGGACVDSQAISGGLGSTGGGPIKIVNNLLAAGGETWIFGGGSATATPCNIEVRRNHSFKPLTWFMLPGTSGLQYPIIKNLGEMKNACLILYEGNIFEDNWAGFQGDQFGTAILATPKSQSSFTSGTVNTTSPNLLTGTGGTTFPAATTRVLLPAGFFTVTSWIDSTHVDVTPDPGNNTGLAASRICVPGLAPNAIVSNMTVRYNMVKHAANGFAIATAQSDCLDQALGIHNVSTHDNLFDDINGVTYTNAASPCCAGGWIFKLTNDHPNTAAWPSQLNWNHNTGIAKGFSGGKGQGLFLQCDGLVGGSGTAPLSYFAGVTMTNNIAPDPGIGYLRGSCGFNFTAGGQTGMYGTLLGNECSNNNGGGTCSYSFAKNLLPTGVFSGQGTGAPYPPTNAICGTVTFPTCFPNAGFSAIFVNYNNGNGGDYHLAPGSPYAGQGTDGLDLGANIDLILSFTANVN